MYIVVPTVPNATSFLPFCVYAFPERVNTHAAPLLPLSETLPIIAVFPSADSDTEVPLAAVPKASEPTSVVPS